MMRDGYIDTNGVRLWFEERGDPTGPAVLFVNGAMSPATSWPDDLLDPLARAGCRVVVFDNRDIGLSTHIDFDAHPYAIEDLVADTLGLMDGLGIHRAHLVGQSMGGIIGQLLALHHADRLASLTLLNTTPGPDDRLAEPVDGLFSVFDRQVDQSNDPEEDALDVTVEFCRRLSGSRFGFDEAAIRRDLAADAARGTNPACSHGNMPGSASSRVDELATVEARTLIVHGDEDPLFPVDHAVVTAAAIPGSTLVVWEGVGHELPAPLAPELARLVLGLVEI